MRNASITVGATVLALALAGCSGNSEAATALAEACIDDPEKTTIVVDGDTVYQSLGDDQRAFNETANQDINEDNISEVINDDNGGLAAAFLLLIESQCLAEESGVPTDADGHPVPGEYTEWDVENDQTASVYTAVK